MAERPLRVALLGAGVVGSQVARILTTQADILESRIGRRLELVGIGVRRADVERPGIDKALFTTDLEALVSGDVDLVVELIGGIDPARSLLLAAMEHGASVVTANKALLASHMEELSETALRNDVDLYYEAAVAGAIPIIRPLRESLVGDRINAVMGIINGTTNYILDKMTSEGWDYDRALSEAQQLGFAEADPTADVEGHDAAAKAAIVAGLAFHTHISLDQVHCEGITGITAGDIAAATELDCVVKLLAVTRLTEEEPQRVVAKVHPALVPRSHPLASVSGAFNAIYVDSEEAGQLMFLGQGAGGAPTASAVMGDVVTVARNRVRGASTPLQTGYQRLEVAPVGVSRARWFFSMDAVDRPGILAAIAAIFGDHNVSLQTVQQLASGGDEQHQAHLRIMTHEAAETDLAAVIEVLRDSDMVDQVHFLRVEGM